VIAPELAVKNLRGRPRVTIKPEQVHQLRILGTSWRRTSEALGIGTATAMRLLKSIDGTRPNTQDLSSKTEGKIQSDSRINS
jgi:hypothetical protein